jgi:hypothetical protein
MQINSLRFRSCYAAVATGVGRMLDYRIYCLDGAGKISFAETINAASDPEAIARAHDMKRHTLKCEVWEGRRLVATLSAQDLAG